MEGFEPSGDHSGSSDPGQPDFIAVDKPRNGPAFRGPRPGYAFKLGSHGLGYYKDSGCPCEACPALVLRRPQIILLEQLIMPPVIMPGETRAPANPEWADAGERLKACRRVMVQGKRARQRKARSCCSTGSAVQLPEEADASDITARNAGC